MKAWLFCYDPNDYQPLHDLVYAETRGKAKMEVKYLTDMDYTNVRVRRAPEFDNDEGKAPPSVVWLEKGWSHTCDLCCDAMVHPGDAYKVSPGGNVYCESCSERLAGIAARL